MIKLVINLERRTDRKEYFTENNKLSEVKFITAVDGESEDLSMYPTREGWVDPFLNRPITKAEVACFLSHRKAWQYCLDKQESVIVMEDDAIINDTWDEEYYEYLSNYWDFVYLQRNENEPDKTVYIDDKLERPWYPYNMTAYVLSPKGAKKLLATDIMKGIIPVDEYLPELIQSGEFIPVALQKDACNQASVDILASDIRRKNMMHVVTIGTDINKMKRLYQSASKHGVAINNWGFGVDWKGTDMTGPGGGMKVNILKEHLSDYPDTDTILFTDAYDVFYADNLNTIKERYESFGKKIVFSAEATCWPDPSIAEQFPKVDTPYRFLNSGTFIAEVGELRTILEADTVADDGDDQLFYQKAYLEGLYDIVLDTEGYIFQTHEPNTQIINGQLNNGICCPCIYHGNGGDDAKETFEKLYDDMYNSKTPWFLPNLGGYEQLEKDMIMVDFMSPRQCQNMIDIANAHNDWKSLDYDKFPAQELRLKEINLWDDLCAHWDEYIKPIVEKYWKPLEMYGLRDAFVLKYDTSSQTKLALHHDASYVTGSVKLNDDYVGGELVFPRQDVSNINIPAGKLLLFPGAVTHPHECVDLISGTKYSLTIWSSRYPGDIL